MTQCGTVHDENYVMRTVLSMGPSCELGWSNIHQIDLQYVNIVHISSTEFQLSLLVTMKLITNKAGGATNIEPPRPLKIPR